MTDASEREAFHASNLRSILAAVLFLAIAAEGLRPYYVAFLFRDRQRWESFLTAFPDRRTPDFPLFLDEVRRRVPEGKSVAILTPVPDWGEGYGYTYYRASYLLAGRDVIPLLTPEGRLVPERMKSSDYVAIWRSRMPDVAGNVVWSGDGGALLKVQR